MQKTIELDCAPGAPRPGDLLPAVIKGLDIDKDPEDTVGRLFGEWTWDFAEVSDERWKEVQPVLKERITQLFHRGTIRYGSW